MTKGRINPNRNAQKGKIPSGDGSFNYITKGQLTRRPMVHGGKPSFSKPTGIYGKSNKS